MSKHTKGKWSVGGDEGVWIESDNPNANVICDIVGRTWDSKAKGYVITPEDWANANLIAASPDLYEALETAMVLLEAMNAKCTGDTAMIQRCRAALAKAKGESQ